MAGTAEAIQEIFAAMPSQINADAAKGMNSVIQFKLSGDGGGDYYVEIKDGTAKVTQGTHPSPNMTMTLAASDYVDLIGSSPRYAKALAHSSDPESYVRAVTEAGYATDPDYASKWLSIYHGERLDEVLRGLNTDALEPIW